MAKKSVVYKKAIEGKLERDTLRIAKAVIRKLTNLSVENTIDNIRTPVSERGFAEFIREDGTVIRSALAQPKATRLERAFRNLRRSWNRPLALWTPLFNNCGNYLGVKE
jgi:hypothetical protein